MYWSIKFGETCRAVALLSKLPLTLSSGRSFFASTSRPIRSRTAFSYSRRLSRRSGTRPGAAWTLTARRHQAAAQLADHFLRNFCMLPVLESNALQHQAARFSALAMATDAVLIDESG